MLVKPAHPMRGFQTATLKLRTTVMGEGTCSGVLRTWWGAGEFHCLLGLEMLLEPSPVPQANGGLVPHYGMSWAGWCGPESGIRDGVGSRTQGPGPQEEEAGLGVGENTAPCQIWVQAWLQTLAGRESRAGWADLEPHCEAEGSGAVPLLCRGKGRLAVCPALSERKRAPLLCELATPGSARG